MDEDEKDKEFISRWARRKVSVQSSKGFLDGRKSFIFSWDKKHREIHKEALLHFFDPSKKGQTFEYHPPRRKALTKPITSRSQREMDPFTTSEPYLSVPERLLSMMKGTGQIPRYVESNQSCNTGGFSGPAFGDTPIERALSTAVCEEQSCPKGLGHFNFLSRFCQ